MSNPIIVHDQPATGTNETTKTDGTPERHIYRTSELFSLPRGILMQKFATDGSVTFIGQYYNKLGNANSRPKRIYRIELFRDLCEWRAAIFEDSTRLAVVFGPSKWTVAYAALGALRGILHRRCVSTNGNRRARKAAKNPVNPVNPVQNKEIA